MKTIQFSKPTISLEKEDYDKIKEVIDSGWVSIGKNVESLGFYKDEVVMAKNDNILVLTFHPELTMDMRIHKYFLNQFSV